MSKKVESIFPPLIRRLVDTISDLESSGQRETYIRGFVNGINEARAQIVKIKKNYDPYTKIRNNELDLLDEELAKIMNRERR